MFIIKLPKTAIPIIESTIWSINVPVISRLALSSRAAGVGGAEVLAGELAAGDERISSETWEEMRVPWVL